MMWSLRVCSAKMLMLDGRYAEAAEAMKIAHDLDRGDVDHAMNYAVALERSGRIDLALEVIDHCRFLEPEDPYLHYAWGKVRMMHAASPDDAETRRHARAALESLDRAAELGSTNEELQLWRALAFVGLDEGEPALEALGMIPEPLRSSERVAAIRAMIENSAPTPPD